MHVILHAEIGNVKKLWLEVLVGKVESWVQCRNSLPAQSRSHKIPWMRQGVGWQTVRLTSTYTWPQCAFLFLGLRVGVLFRVKRQTSSDFDPKAKSWKRTFSHVQTWESLQAREKIVLLGFHKNGYLPELSSFWRRAKLKGKLADPVRLKAEKKPIANANLVFFSGGILFPERVVVGLDDASAMKDD